MKKNHTVSLPESIIKLCAQLPMTRSAVIAHALLAAARDPELLVLALRRRIAMRAKEEAVKITYSRDTKLDEALEQLTEVTTLSGEQVIRLSVEAYVHSL